MEEPKTAPGQLELVRGFVNTLALEDDQDELSTGRALAAWLNAQGLASPGVRVSRRDLHRALELREAMRALLLANNEGVPAPAKASATIDGAAARARLTPRLGTDGRSALVPQAGGVDGALGRLVAIVHAAAADGTWCRLKACRKESCRWAFYDQTKNRSGSWCTMAVCGNRAKAQAYRVRRSSPQVV